MSDQAPVAGPDGIVVGTVRALARYPVKSTAGEQLSAAVVGTRGLAHDREWAAYTADGGIASGKTTRRFRRVDGLLAWRSRVAVVDGATVPVLHGPDGTGHRVDDPAAADALARSCGQPLTLRREGGSPHLDECGVHLVTTSSLDRIGQIVGGPVDAGRTRANVVLDTDDLPGASGSGFVEDEWIGADLALGPEVVLRLLRGMRRCRMVDLPQTGVAAGPPALTALGRTHELLLGLATDVVRPGTVSVGDTAVLLRRD